jgi:hypothetical protein
MSADNSDEVIFLVNDSGDLEKVPNRPYDSEDILQSLIEKYPELLAGDQINPDEPVRWIMIKREVGIPGGEQESGRWSVDHLLLDQNATPTFVETKRSSNTEIRRQIVGQMFDYAANAQRYWPLDYIRSLALNKYGGADAVEAKISEVLGIESGDNSLVEVEAYWARVEDNLRHGHVRLLFVADRLPRELRRIIEFLNEKMEEVEVLGVELAQYVGSNIKALVPRVIGQTEVIRQRKQQPASSKRRIINMEEFLDNCPKDSQDFFRRAIEESQQHGMHIYWGTTGFSLRAQDAADRLITIFYGFPSGGQSEGSAVIQGYVGNIEDLSYRDQIHQRFLTIPGTIPSGQYTVSLDLNRNTLENAGKLLELAWEISTEISSINSSEDIQA